LRKSGLCHSPRLVGAAIAISSSIHRVRLQTKQSQEIQNIRMAIRDPGEEGGPPRH
jgi:hypothetical protein